MLYIMNSALCLIPVLNRCTSFHMYVKYSFPLEAIAKFICNVKQGKIKNNTKTMNGNEDWNHKSSREA